MAWQTQFPAKGVAGPDPAALARMVALNNRGKLNCTGRVEIDTTGPGPWTVPTLLCTPNSFIALAPQDAATVNAGLYTVPFEGYFEIHKAGTGGGDVASTVSWLVIG